MSDVIYLFHHLHHRHRRHQVHHCDQGDHRVNYRIRHCRCGQHAINKQSAVGHTVDTMLRTRAVRVTFTKKCPHGGWHIESGKVK